MGKSSTISKNKWNAANYDRINLILPKDSKETLRQASKDKSINKYIVDAINEQLIKDGFSPLVTEAEKKKAT